MVLVGLVVLGACGSPGTASGAPAGPSTTTSTPGPTDVRTDQPGPTSSDETTGSAPDFPAAGSPAAGSSAPGDSAPGTAPSASTAPTALATLALLEVKGRAPQTGYDRDLFAYRAVDLDRNGCDTRNDILRRDLVDQSVRGDGCVVESGTLVDPYSGRTIGFVRGQATSADVQIDHVVALSDAWQKGAQRWDAATRESFGNDPLNLLAVDGPLNQSKGAGDAATWLPPHRAFRCAYVARQVAVKHAYGLWVTQAERDAIARVLATCPDERVPSAGAPTVGSPAPTVPDPTVPEPTATEPTVPGPTAPQPTTAPPPNGGEVYYASCAQARAAGAAPLHRGDPGYRSGLDRDDDGIACE